MRQVRTLLIIATYAALAPMLLDRYLHLPISSRWFIMAASTGYVAIAVAGRAWASTYGRLVLAALAMCWVGDMTGPMNFVVGALAFLVGHLFLIAAFLTQGISTRHALATAAGVVCAGAAVLVWLYPHIHPGHVPLVLGYLCVISTMVTLAGGIVDKNRLALLAAVVFYASDIFVARWKYVETSSHNALFCGPLYYTACILFAVSIVRAVAPTDAPAAQPPSKTVY